MMVGFRGHLQNKDMRRFYVAIKDRFGCFKGFIGANSETALNSKLCRLDLKPLGKIIPVMEWFNYGN